MTQEKYKEVAVLAAKEAGNIHKKYFNQKFEIKTKDTSFNFVTAADIEAEKTVVAIIRERFPQHDFIAEENKYARTGSEYTWVIDPLDGTNNFIHGLPIFSVSIALVKNDEIILGVVYDPMRDELFYAEKGRGAFLNGQKVSVSSVEKLDDSLLITGFYYDRGDDMIENLDKIKQFLLKKIVGLRRLGSAALDLCYIACGRAAGFWEFKLNPWDFAAGKLIVEEAGGKVTAKDGKPVPLKTSFIAASNGKIHEAMLEILR